MNRVLVTRRLPSLVLEKLKGLGAVDVYSGETAMSAAELRERAADAQAIVCMLTDSIDRDLLNRSKALRIVANVAVGYNNIDVAHARARGVVVTNTPDVLTDSVADFT